MKATHNLTKPLNVFTPQAHKPTILNLHPNNVTILSSSTSGGNWRVLRQEMRLRDRLQPTETMGLSGPDPKVVATKRPITRMCMCQNKRVPSWRSVKLESLGGGDAPSEALLVAKRARLNPHLLDNAECEFKEILWKRDLVEFKDLEECAWRMEMSGKEDAAVKDLECYISCKSIGSEEIYKARLVLVEMLIYQGDYGRARQTLEELKGVQPEKDYKPPFYLAVVYVLLGEEVEAKKQWDEFKKISEQNGTSPPDTVTDDESPETPRKRPDEEDPHISESGPSKTPMAEAFSQFKRLVKELGQEIAAVRCK